MTTQEEFTAAIERLHEAANELGLELRGVPVWGLKADEPKTWLYEIVAKESE